MIKNTEKGYNKLDVNKQVMLFCCSPSVKCMCHSFSLHAFAFPNKCTGANSCQPAPTIPRMSSSFFILTDFGGFCHVRFYHTIPTLEFTIRGCLYMWLKSTTPLVGSECFLVFQVKRGGEKLEGGTNQLIRQVLGFWRPGQRSCIGVVLSGKEVSTTLSVHLHGWSGE